MALDKLHTAGSGFIESFGSRYPSRILETLLSDRTTGHNIIWADNEYEALGDGYMDIDGETVEYAFDLNEFFATNENGYFLHNDDVDRFLNALTTQKKFPFSTPELRDELRHTFWMLNRVDSAKALAKKLRQHPVFKDYEIVLAAGDGKLDDDEASAQAFDKVREAIAEHDRTITLSVGQLTTGVTVPEWTAVLMDSPGQRGNGLHKLGAV